MSSEYPGVPKDGFLKIKKFSPLIESHEFNNYNSSSNNNPLVSVLANWSQTFDQSKGKTSKNNTSQTLALFRKSLHKKAQEAMGWRSAQESEANGSQCKIHQPLVHLITDANLSRKPTLLEKKLLPGARGKSSRLSTSSSSSKAQLTIFYSGTINVYDNVPTDKAQAIMLLASQSSLLDPVSPTTPTSSDHHGSSKLPPLSNMDIPIARKLSLRRFLKKRHDRITARSPYTCRTSEPQIQKASSDDNTERKQIIPLSVFPEHFSHVK